jgi:two-component system, NtrC family, response regulator GlrR
METVICSNLSPAQASQLARAANQLKFAVHEHGERHSWVRVLGGARTQASAVFVGAGSGTAPWKTVDEIRRIDSGVPVFGWLAGSDSQTAMDALRTGVSGLLHAECDDSFVIARLDPLRKKQCNVAQALCAQSTSGRVLANAVQALSESELDVLLTGPSGSGKEVCARLVHQTSARRKAPLVVMNCAAIPHDLMESELFGHTKGAFTGAGGEAKGLFREANGGTLLIDEVAALSLSAQAKLLRVLQEREIRPVGSMETFPVDIRVIATTNQNLLELAAKGSFREDLYYRLCASSACMPALHERRADIPLITRRILAELATQNKAEPRRFSREAMTALTAANWPGNIRQLRAIVCSAASLTDQSLIAASHLQELLGTNYRANDPELFHLLKGSQDFSVRYLHQTIQLAQGSYRDAAKLADIHLSSLYRLAPPNQTAATGRSAYMT